MILLVLIPILIAWFFAVRWLARHITKNITLSWKKSLAMWVLVPLLFLLPFWDEIAGDIYMKQLCDADGGLLFIKPIESVKRAKLAQLPNRIIWFGFQIEASESQYIDLDTKEVFARTKGYYTYGGLIRNTFRLDGSRTGCGIYAISRARTQEIWWPNHKKLEQLLEAGELK